jgi:hypothetical protein
MIYWLFHKINGDELAMLWNYLEVRHQRLTAPQRAIIVYFYGTTEDTQLANWVLKCRATFDPQLLTGCDGLQVVPRTLR